MHEDQVRRISCFHVQDSIEFKDPCIVYESTLRKVKYSCFIKHLMGQCGMYLGNLSIYRMILYFGDLCESRSAHPLFPRIHFHIASDIASSMLSSCIHDDAQTIVGGAIR